MPVVAGDWRRRKVIGRGSSATVSLVSSDSGELFAVKFAELPRSRMLQREQRILSSLNSPFVISYIDFNISAMEGATYYNLVLEYAPGGSLSDHVKKECTKMDELAISCFAVDILNGLAYIHSNGVVHCDIKGQNVLVGSNGRAKIADFGCARCRQNDDGIEFMGTPVFMAPEVARGEEQGEPADIWAFGCTVLEMMTGRLPWSEVSDPITAIHRIGFSDYLPEIPSWVSNEGKDFLSKCLVRDPRRRWSAEQLLQHPYVKNSQRKADENQHWVSPKSILDQEFWESASNEEDELVFDELLVDDPVQRILKVMSIGGTDNVPRWTFDQNWITVRCGNECSTSSSGNDSVENSINFDTSFSRRGVKDNSHASTSEDVMMMCSSNGHMKIKHFVNSSCDCACVYEGCCSCITDVEVQVEKITREQFNSCKIEGTVFNQNCDSLGQCIRCVRSHKVSLISIQLCFDFFVS